MTSKTIAQGAEAVISQTKKGILKSRIKKSYRISELDNKIRKLRTRAEAKIMKKCFDLLPVPEILEEDENKKTILMQNIKGKKLSQHLDKFTLKKQKEILKQIGQSIAKLHSQDIIHGDLTTSNMIYIEKKNLLVRPTSSTSLNLRSQSVNNPKKSLSKAKVYFIDFGLAFQNAKYEDKAVDIHLLKQALEAKHFKHWKELYKEFEKAYKLTNKKEAEKVLNQLNKVEKRGRYRH